MFKTFVFQQEQKGVWGWCLMPKRIVIRALNEDEAWIQVKRRSDFVRTMRNGDVLTWRLITSPVMLERIAPEVMRTSK